MEVAPPPRPLTLPIHPGQPVCPAPIIIDGADPTSPGGTPTPSAEIRQEYSQYIERTVDPENVLNLIIGRPRLLIFKEAPKRIQIEVDESNPVATYTVITEREISLTGRQLGAAVLNLWFTDPKDPKKERILSYLLQVVPDVEAQSSVRERLTRYYKQLEAEINRAFPDSSVCLSVVGDNLVVAGQAKDIAEATQILNIVSNNNPQVAEEELGLRVIPPAAPGQTQPAGLPPPMITTTRTQYGLAGATSQTTQQPTQAAARPSNIINMLRVPGEQQVMLRVTVAEVNRAAARSIGLNFSFFNNSGLPVFTNLTGNLLGGGRGGGGGLGGLGGVGGAGGAGGGLTGQGLGPGINLPTFLDNGQIFLAINALRNVNLARSLAEPTLVTMNGQTATFQAGGQFPVPVVTGFTAAGLQGVSFVPFGVQLNFTPYITDKDRLRLNVAAAVSTLDLATATTIGNSNVPGLNTRNFQTTVELREGQTLAVAGLIQNNFSAGTSRVPGIGDVPLLGRLTNVDRTSHGEQELVILITPELVHPLEPHEKPPLPGSDVFEPGDLEFYLLGRMESRRPYDYRSGVMNDLQRMTRYRHCEQLFIIGRPGHANIPEIK
ncbi:MAG: type II and III secretion system protein family protein [Gemmataceae bacterium]